MDRDSGPSNTADAKKLTARSAARAFDVLEYFIRTGRPARTSEISASLGIPNSSVDELLRTMAIKGYLAFNKDSRRYSPSYRLMALMRGLESRFFGDGRLRKMLHRLRVETGGTVIMTAQNDCWLESIAQIQGPWRTPPTSQTDKTWPIVNFGEHGWQPATNFAGALLSLHSNSEIIDLAVHTQAMGLAPKGNFVMQGLIEDVRRIRSRGYAITRRDDVMPVSSVACPMRIPGTDVAVAVGILSNDLLGDDASARKIAMTTRHVIYDHCRRWKDAA
ncbi:helix-turn-helix domain-containing protein [Sphingomonas crocodyli]|uniref:helix-turn-helix domain-containing protein n=1 Tax=Sphingomonas crocodyli TaxID=1979270 RepID=UPI0013E2D3B0|nr:helix-turn-helix domain-containing protein [Sphingomonas crocodyli]